MAQFQVLQTDSKQFCGFFCPLCLWWLSITINLWSSANLATFLFFSNFTNAWKIVLPIDGLSYRFFSFSFAITWLGSAGNLNLPWIQEHTQPFIQSVKCGPLQSNWEINNAAGQYGRAAKDSLDTIQSPLSSLPWWWWQLCCDAFNLFIISFILTHTHRDCVQHPGEYCHGNDDFEV